MHAKDHKHQLAQNAMKAPLPSTTGLPLHFVTVMDLHIPGLGGTPSCAANDGVISKADEKTLCWDIRVLACDRAAASGKKKASGSPSMALAPWFINSCRKASWGVNPTGHPGADGQPIQAPAG
eukprot:CAMPEP_0202920678 /NCGR_PEP_ID=MMETSP1392-20130828/76983_1 /ASSEMBLY_ACC=CAM_ASM_000868 /TAXON_ID=225041 /ORGANISM="Chlamydomonas chlamydogama, Strain SAG 11-48b" /LENGTH=122 /DNA_ID=CAMNT_0049614185 /DNA_START=1090 /DNA_END=1458 /DNA_ORIENTATION=-